MSSFLQPSQGLHSPHPSPQPHKLNNPGLLEKLVPEESPPLSIAGKNSECRKLMKKSDNSDESLALKYKRHKMSPPEEEPAAKRNDGKTRTGARVERVTCDYEGCRKSFGRAQDLKRHMVTHFRTALALGVRSVDLAARYNQHTRQIGEARVLFKCTKCGFFASRRDSLVRHQKESCGSKSKKPRRTGTTRNHFDAERPNARRRKRQRKVPNSSEKSRAESSSPMVAALTDTHIHEGDRPLPRSMIISAGGDFLNSTRVQTITDPFLEDSIFPLSRQIPTEPQKSIRS